MVRRNLTLPHRLVCVTDEDISVEGVEIVRPPREFDALTLPTWPDFRPQCLRRLVMFRPDAVQWFGERFACMDLDCVISGSLDPILGVRDDFRMARGTAPERPYNGSLILMNAGARPQVYTRFSHAGAIEAGQKFVGSDQAWISHCLGPDEPVWQESDGLLYYGLPRSNSSPRHLTFFPGQRKPWDFAEPWFRDHYRLFGQGRCLILGYDDTLWDDVDRALDDGPYDGVISSPEAAEHWPGEIVAIARTNNDAARLAHLHGFDDVTWCGVKRREAA